MQSLKQMMRVLTLTQAILLFILLGISRAETAAEPSDEIATRKIVYEMDIDNLIDENMETIRRVAWELDPFKLDDINFPVIPSIYMYLHTGWAQNLAQLNRAGKCKIRYADKKLDIDLILGWEDLVFDYRYLINMLLYKRNGDLHGEMTKLNVYIGLQVNFKNYHVTLKKLELEDKGKINISLEGHLLDHIYNMVIKAVTRVFRSVTLKTISDKMRMMIIHRIDEINFKLGSIVNGRRFMFIDLTNHDNSQIMYNNNIDDNSID